MTKLVELLLVVFLLFPNILVAKEIPQSKISAQLTCKFYKQVGQGRFMEVGGKGICEVVTSKEMARIPTQKSPK